MREFDAPAKEWGDKLDTLKQAAIDGGKPLSDILGEINKAGPTALQMGWDFSQTAHLLSVFEDAGQDSATAVNALHIATANLPRTPSRSRRSGAVGSHPMSRSRTGTISTKRPTTRPGRTDASGLVHRLGRESVALRNQWR